MSHSVDNSSSFTSTVSPDMFSGLNLSDFQRAQIVGMSKLGIACLVDGWRKELKKPIHGKFCNVIWDGLNCWPATVPNETIGIPCSQIASSHFALHQTFLDGLTGSAFRVCSQDGVWVNGYSNYSSCTRQIKESMLEQELTTNPPSLLRAFIPYVLLSGSILSIVCLIIAICVYIYLKSMYLDRLKILLQMMTALLLKSILWIIIVGPVTFPNALHFRVLGWLCNVAISLHFYSLLVVTCWMLVLGHFLNEKLSTEHVRSQIPIRKYVAFSWVVPAFIVSLWAILMEFTNGSGCWSNYTKSHVFWIIVTPLVASFLGNLMYLTNIFSAVVGRLQFIQNPSRLNQIRKAKRDLVILFPLLGINNLLFLYNPGGTAEEYYMLFHAFFQSVQGGIVAILCCFVSAHVSNTLWKKLNRSFCARQRQRQFGMNANKCSRRTPAIGYRKDQVNVSILNIPT